ncbi:hypothetical protein MKW98_013269, partial [Papaver atlanticum]
GNNNGHNAGINGDSNGSRNFVRKKDYKGKNKDQDIHISLKQDEQSTNAAEFIFSSLTNAISGGMDGGQFVD